MNRYLSISHLGQLGLFALALLIIKSLLIPLVHEVDADAVSRVYLSLAFAESPHIISTGNWPPLFFYIMGGALMLFENQFFTPVFVNILFSVALLFPLFLALRRHFGEQIALALSVFFSFSPIVFRLSLLAMSELPYLFFLVLSLNALSKALVERKLSWIAISGLFMTVAGGMRYESWIFGILIIAFLAHHRRFKEALYFAVPFAFFPVYWLVSNSIHARDALNSFNWAIDLSVKERGPSFNSILRRIWWYPLSLMFAFGPVAFYFFIKELRHFREKKLSRLLFTAFIVFLAIWLINALRGSLLLQHRFSLTLFLLAFPFLGFYFQRKHKRLWLKTIVFSATAFFLAYAYSSKGARPIPRLKTENAVEVSQAIRSQLDENSGFICDFWNWETTYYLPFSTALPPGQIEIIEDRQSPESAAPEIKALMKQYPEGVVLVSDEKTLRHLVDTDHQLSLPGEVVPLRLFYENDHVRCFTYDLTQ